MNLTRIAATIVVGLSFITSVVGQDADLFRRKNIEQRMLSVARWQLAHPKHAPNDWTNGAFYAGVVAAYETTHSPELFKALLDMGNGNEWKPGPRFDHADDLVIAQTYLDLYRIKHDRRMLDPTIQYVHRLQTEPSTEAAKNGITWWWCDALFMGPPALAKLSRITRDRSYLELNDKLFHQTYDRLFDGKESLYARDASYLTDAQGKGKREANGNKIFWSRGNGWVAAGLARLLDELPTNYSQRQFYLTQYRAIMTRIISLQQSDGLWRSSLLDPQAYPGGEASGTGFYVYALAWGINNGTLDRKTFQPALIKAWRGLNTLIHEDGMVGWTQPIGADPRRDFGPDSWEVYGAGAYLLAGSEVVRLKGLER